jgi:hypothetical protein
MAAGKWIQGAHLRKGALHRALGVPEDEKIPADKLAQAENSDNPKVRKMADTAKTLEGLHHKDTARRGRWYDHKNED